MSASRESSAGMMQEQSAPIVRAEPSRIFNGDPRRKIHVKRTQPRAFEINTNDWNSTAAQALGEHQTAHALTDKEMARKIGCNDRTYENYRLGRTAPSSVNFLRCLCVIPEFQAAVDDLCALQRECDPRAMEAMSEMYQAAQKWADYTFGKDDADNG